MKINEDVMKNILVSKLKEGLDKIKSDVNNTKDDEDYENNQKMFWNVTNLGNRINLLINEFGK